MLLSVGIEYWNQNITNISVKDVFTIFALCTGFKLTEINIVKYRKPNPSWIIDFFSRGGGWLPVFPILGNKQIMQK